MFGNGYILLLYNPLLIPHSPDDNKDHCIVRHMKERMRQDRVTTRFTATLPRLLLTLYPLLGIGLIGYTLTLDLPYLLPLVYITMVILVQILLLKVGR